MSPPKSKTPSRNSESRMSASPRRQTSPSEQRGQSVPAELYDNFQKRISQNPAAALVTAFAAGAGLGLVVGFLLGESPAPPPKWYEKLGANDQGRRLMDGLSDMWRRDA